MQNVYISLENVDNQKFGLKPFWLRNYKPTTFKHDKTQQLLTSSPTLVLFPTVIFVPLHSIEILIVSSGIFYSMSMLPVDFTQHSGIVTKRQSRGFYSFIVLSCVSNPSSVLLMLFSLKLPSYVSTMHTFCLHSCQSLIGWQVCGRRCWLIYWLLQVLVVHVCLASPKKGIQPFLSLCGPL